MNDKERNDIIISWVTLSAAFAVIMSRVSIFSLGRGFEELPINFLVSLIAVGGGFVLHELAHKYVAQRYGFWAEFRYWQTGLILGFLMAFTPLLFLAPGAVYISSGVYGMSRRQNAYISLAGATTNVALAFLFTFLEGFVGGRIASFAVQINLLLAMFNMLPIPPLDGSKVFAWSPKNWGIIFVGLIILNNIL